ncbi:MAG: ABC transporter permease [Ruminococcaceae bacterium]|nr:ABC transporter permease [Oscillospiraceae bacterium]MBR3597302.1 ABC transporter permease [Clostridia bacterium]
MKSGEVKQHEPLFHITKRASVVWWKAWLVRVGAIVIALFFSAVLTVVLTGENPIEVFTSLIKGAIGTNRRIWVLFQNTAMLLCIALAVTPAFKMKFWNIGAEGQALIGAMATAACMIKLVDYISGPLLLITMFIASVAAGALWALIPALFKAKWNTNETLFTLMMNYIAIQIVSFFAGEWAVPKGSGKIGIINGNTMEGWLPAIGGKNYLFNILVVAAITVGMYVYLKYSKHGYEISVVGESQNTARYVGINVKKVIIRTMIISGALCGVAGFLLVAGADHTVTRDTIAGRGFTAIMVSWLAKFNPLYMVLTSFFIVFMERGAIQISTSCGLNNSFSEIITGILIFFIIGCEFFLNYEIKFREKEGKK